MYSNWQNPVEQDQSEQGAAHSSVAPFIANGPYNPSDTPNFMETVYFSEAGSTYSLDYGTMFGRSQAAVRFDPLLEYRRRLIKHSRVRRRAGTLTTVTELAAAMSLKACL